MDDVDYMENCWTQEINKCLDSVAPWKTRTFKPKKYHLPDEIKAVVKEQKRLLKIHKSKIQNGEIDPEFTKRLKNTVISVIN